MLIKIIFIFFIFQKELNDNAIEQINNVIEE